MSNSSIFDSWLASQKIIIIFQLALKHRQGKNHKMRIVVFVGSPIVSEEKEAVKSAKRLKKENVNVDIINFGETVYFFYTMLGSMEPHHLTQ